MCPELRLCQRESLRVFSHSPNEGKNILANCARAAKVGRSGCAMNAYRSLALRKMTWITPFQNTRISVSIARAKSSAKNDRFRLLISLATVRSSENTMMYWTNKSVGDAKYFLLSLDANAKRVDITGYSSRRLESATKII